MRKIFFTTLCLLFAIVAGAQTDFREISYADALAAAKTEGKQVFMDFYTDWCGPCKMMARDVFPQKSVGDFMNKQFVSLKVNAEKGEGVDLAKKYNVHSYPTFIIIDTEGKVLYRTEGPSTADRFMSDIETGLNKDKSPEAMKKRYESGDRSRDLIRSYAYYLLGHVPMGNRLERYKYMDNIYHIDSIAQGYFERLSEADKLSKDNEFVYQSFTHDVASPAAQFLTDNLDKLGDRKGEMKGILSQLYNREMYNIFTGMYPFDAAKYKLVKDGIDKLGFNSKHVYDAQFNFIDAEAKGDADAYLDFCTKNYGSLNDKEKEDLVTNFGDHFRNANDETKAKAAKFLRSIVGELAYFPMTVTVMQIGNLEGYVQTRDAEHNRRQ